MHIPQLIVSKCLLDLLVCIHHKLLKLVLIYQHQLDSYRTVLHDGLANRLPCQQHKVHWAFGRSYNHSIGPVTRCQCDLD